MRVKMSFEGSTEDTLDGIREFFKKQYEKDPINALKFTCMLGVAVGQARATALGDPMHYAKMFGAAVSDIIGKMTGGITGFDWKPGTALENWLGVVQMAGGRVSDRAEAVADTLVFSPAERVSRVRKAMTSKKDWFDPKQRVGPVLDLARRSKKRGKVEWSEGAPNEVGDWQKKGSGSEDFVDNLWEEWDAAGYETKRIGNPQPDGRVVFTLWVRTTTPIDEKTAHIIEEQSVKTDVLLMIGDASVVVLFALYLPKLVGLGMSVLNQAWEEGLPGEAT